MRTFAILVSGLLCVTLLGCMETGAGKGAVIGGTSGGVIGGVVGHQSGRTAEGVAIGAVAGAVLGGIIGDQAEKTSAPQAGRTIATCPNGHQVDVTGFPPGTRVRCPICGAEFNM